MAVTSRVFPFGLPKFSSFKMRPLENRVEAAKMSGLRSPKWRRRSANRAAVADVSWLFTIPQRLVFDAFYKATTRLGNELFLMQTPLSGVNFQVVRFQEEFEARKHGHTLYEISTAIEIIDRTAYSSQFNTLIVSTAWYPIPVMDGVSASGSMQSGFMPPGQRERMGAGATLQSGSMTTVFTGTYEEIDHLVVTGATLLSASLEIVAAYTTADAGVELMGAGATLQSGSLEVVAAYITGPYRPPEKVGAGATLLSGVMG